MHGSIQTKSGVLVRRKRIEREERIQILEIITLYHLTAVPKGSTILPGGLTLHNSFLAPEKYLPLSVICMGWTTWP